MWRLNETIGAVCTPPGRGGIGVLRLSGKDAFSIAKRFFLGRFPDPRVVAYGKFQDPASGEILDDGLLFIMPGPRSFTGEDVVEFQGHGSPLILSLLMKSLQEAGVRPAHPGEFTYRAWRNGKLTLMQAEAIEALVSASSAAARRAAWRQYTGGALPHLLPVEELLKELYREVEARLEFAEEGLQPLDGQWLQEKLQGAIAELERLRKSYEQGRVLQEGLVVVFAGPPNVGKSSLFNRLLGRERAIVTEIPGTTRDLLEGEIHLAGVHLRLWDTAGLRRTQDRVEEEGVNRTKKILEEADLVLWVVDLTAPEDGLEQCRREKPPREKMWLVFNKSDQAGLEEKNDRDKEIFSLPFFVVSCRSGSGIDRLERELENWAKKQGQADAVGWTPRHLAEVRRALDALKKAFAESRGACRQEFLAEELREALDALGRIRGVNLPQEAFAEIFQRFCIGK